MDERSGGPALVADSAVVERFLRYVRIDTQSREGVAEVPSTRCQFDLARLLAAELRDLGARDVRVDDRAYVYATIPATLPPERAARVPVIGLIAHLDVSPAVPGNGVRPVVHRGYAGGDLVLPGTSDVVIRAAENPRLAAAVGHDVITSDGTTLLGADDKAGIAAIMTLAADLLGRTDSAPHGEIRLAFTPDEEVGRGAEFFDVAGFGARYAYTVDGEQPGELNDETFNAASVGVTFRGRNVHPGFAKGVMVNSLYAAARFVQLFPPDERPETTERRQGYLHPHELQGGEETTTLKVLLRDFEPDGLARRRDLLEAMAAQVRREFPAVTIELVYRDSYRNLHEVLRHHPEVVAAAEQAIRLAGLEPLRRPIRGGTDGARLSFMGLPCANLFAGTENAHSVREWVSSRALHQSVEVLHHLVAVWARGAA